MREQKSAGIVLFRNASNKNEFLLLNYPQGHWDFVKGKVEKDEIPHETALRETKEETGISDIEFIDGFEESVEYDDALKKTTFRNAKNVLSKANEFLLNTV